VLDTLPNEDDIFSFSIFKLFLDVISYSNLTIENTPTIFYLQFSGIISVCFRWTSEKGQQLFVINAVYCLWKSWGIIT